MRVARTAVASTRRSAPTSASTSGRSRDAPARATSCSTGSPPRLSDARYRSTASGTICPIMSGLYMRRTKIIATVGPASDDDRVLDMLIAAGTDIFRLNFSHGTAETQSRTFRRIRDAAARARCDVAILQDLGGPKIRTGANTGGRPLTLNKGESVSIVTGDVPCEPGVLSTTFAGLARSVKPGDPLLLADGLVELRVDSTDGRTIHTTVVEGGQL